MIEDGASRQMRRGPQHGEGQALFGSTALTAVQTSATECPPDQHPQPGQREQGEEPCQRSHRTSLAMQEDGRCRHQGNQLTEEKESDDDATGNDQSPRYPIQIQALLPEGDSVGVLEASAEEKRG